MNALTLRIKRLPTILWNHRGIVAIFLIFLAIFEINALHFTYPDEFDNIVGGYFIDHGRLPYIGFFTHHGPFTYFFASVITLFGRASFVRFRLLEGLVYFVLYLLFYLYTKSRFGIKASNLILLLYSFLIVGATYWWGHMLLADTLAGLLILGSYILIFLTISQEELFTKKDLIIISILNTVALLTSFTYIYAIAILYAFLGAQYLFKKTQRSFVKPLSFFVILFLPYVIFLLYLLITRSLGDFYYQAVFFNQAYYARSPSGLKISNPIREAIDIFYNFFKNYRAELGLSKDMNLGSPFTAMQAVADLFLIIYLVIKRKFKTLTLVIGLLAYLNVRSNPYSTSETDYQAVPYTYFSLFNGLFLLRSLWDELKITLESNKKLIYSTLLLILGTYTIFSFLFLFDKGAEKAFKKYMGTQSTIYDRPAVANTLNGLLGPNDYYYIGPFAFEEHLYMKSGKLASRYFITIPAMDQSDKIKSELLADIKTHKPKIVVFDTEYYIFGSAPGLYLVDYLRQNYFTLAQLKASGENFDIKTKWYGDFDFERHFFFDKNRKDEIVKELIDQHLITPKEATPSSKKV